jgi:lipopolysaccharide/colanic/teichoic acid biosynthesis glycosyltransferase
VYYVENWSLAFDIKILLKTIGTVFRDKHAY